MASYSVDRRGFIKIKWTDGKPRSISLGPLKRGKGKHGTKGCTRTDAQLVTDHITAICTAKRINRAIDPKTELWLSEIPIELARKLAGAGLIPEPSATTLGGFLDEFISGEVHRKAENTIKKYKRVRKSLVEYFTPDRPLHSISEADADQWQQSLFAAGHADGTVNMATATAKMFFGHAQRRGAIRGEPFKKVKKPNDSNPERFHFIDRNVIDRAINAAPDGDWRLIIALARYAGLRFPSEIRDFRWRDVDFVRGIMRIKEVKNKRHGRAIREVPIFKALRPYLWERFQDAQSRTAPFEHHVIKRHAESAASLRRQFEKILKVARIDQWEKLFQNLRSSCETELIDGFPTREDSLPPDVVAAYLGHSRRVQQRHYAQVTDAHWAKATGLESGARSGAAVDENPLQSSASAPDGREDYLELQTVADYSSCVHDADNPCRGYWVFAEWLIRHGDRQSE